MRIKILNSLLATVPILLLAPSAGVAAGEKDHLNPKIPWIVQQQIEGAGSPGVSRLSSAVPAGMVEVVFHAADLTGEAEERDLEALGARIVSTLNVPANLPPEVMVPKAGQIHALIPADRLEEAADLPWVVAVTAVDPGAPDPHPTNPIDSEGVALHNADLLHAQGVTGAGVNVGAISDGVTNLAASQAQNELPAVNVLAAGAGDEGTAMLENIHDMAPGANLLFAATGGSVATHVNALNNLVAAGANVITEDWAFDSEPAFQQGLAAVTAENIAAAGVPVHSSAGNRGQNHAARVAAVGTGAGPDGFNGPFAGCTINPTNTVAIAPGGDTTFDLTLGNGSSFTLQWSEPRAIFPTAGQGGFTDLDLYIMNQAGTTCLFQSLTPQGNGVGDTIEQINTPAASNGTQVKVVVNVSGVNGAAAAPIIDLRWRGTAGQIDAPTRAGSLNPDSNYIALATSAAAVNGISGTIEGFSSGGPVQLGLTTLWNGAGNPGLPGPGPGNVTAPTWAAADGVAISGVGGFGTGTCPAVNPGDCRFFGTSSAAPHAAGCDALVRDAFNMPAAAVAFTNNQLAVTAVDLGAPGIDNVSGAGQLDCLAAAGAPTALCTNRTVPTDAGVCQATNVSIDNGSFDPEGGPLTLAQNPPEPYLLGLTLVTLTVTDPQGLTDMCSANVTVLDQEAPSITAPADATAECTSPAGTPVALGTPTAADNCAIPTIGNDAPAAFPLGLTTVTWTATDPSGNVGSDTQIVTIVDTTPPDFELVLTPNELWPPDHKLVSIETDIQMLTDVCDAAPTVRLVSITSNEPDDGLGDGDTPNDIQGADFGQDDRMFLLRAERSGLGDGRVYTVTYVAEDASGNQTSKQATVTVPKSRSGQT